MPWRNLGNEATGRIQEPMKKKYLISLLMIVMISLLLAGCGKSKETQYQSYVQSLITANYLGTSDEYIKTTGVNESDAEALYLQNASRLANNLIRYYGLDIANDPEMAPRMTDVAKLIYSKIRFSVSAARMENGIYYVDVTIHPINILNDSHDDAVDCIGEFNKKVKAGEYNDYTKEEYQRALASGLLDILEEHTKNLTYLDPQVVTVRIIEGKDTYYISDDDLKAIDNLVIATVSDENKKKKPEEGGTEEKKEDGTDSTEKSWG